MDYNVPKTQEKIRTEFERMLEFVMSEEAKEVSADQVERSLFQWLLSLGAQLLLLFFQVRSASCEREGIIVKGQRVRYNSEQKRVYFSIFGKVPFWRPYFHTSKSGGHTPLDEELSLGLDRYSRVEQAIVAEDAEDVLAYYEQKPAPAAKDEAEVLVIQADGKGVPLILEKPLTEPVRLGKGQKRGRKKEAIVTTVYTIAANPRTPEDVVNSFFQDEKSKITLSKPQNKHIWATLDGKTTALSRLGQEVASRQGSHIQHKVALADGCEALQKRIKEEFPDLILDFVHANEYLWKVANSLFGEKDEGREKWVKKQTALMLSGKIRMKAEKNGSKNKQR